MLGPLSHFDNFARLHQASPADIEALLRLIQSVPGPSLQAVDWLRLPTGLGLRIIVATESDVIVGACVTRHPPSSARAKLVWIGVTPAARGRGIGPILVDAAIDHLRTEGAALVTARLPAGSEELRALLDQIGFRRPSPHAASVGLSLWDRRSASLYGAQNPPDYVVATPEIASGIPALMLAMATLDPMVMLTPHVERQLSHEASLYRDVPAGLSCALLAARRGFVTKAYGLPVPTNPLTLDVGTLDQLQVTPTLPTAEQLVGELSRRHLPMLRARFPRLMRQPNWLLVTGFDGYLFRIVEPAGPGHVDGAVAVTLAEMRSALRAAGSVGIILSRPL